MRALAFVLLLAMTTVGWSQKKPTAVDVAPIQEEYGNPGMNFCDMGACTWMDADPAHPNALTPTPYRRTRMTCADKTRFLMTAEDGSKHCIALGATTTPEHPAPKATK